MQQQCFDCRTWTDMAGKLESLGDMHAQSSRRLSVAKRSRTACRTDSTKPRGQLDIDVFEGESARIMSNQQIQQKRLGAVRQSEQLPSNPIMIP